MRHPIDYVEDPKKRERHSQSLPIANSLLQRAAALVGRVMTNRHPAFSAVPVVKRSNVLAVALDIGLRQLEADMLKAESEVSGG